MHMHACELITQFPLPRPFALPSDCYSECYSYTAGQMNGTELALPWHAAFASPDAAQGGCPTVVLPPSALESGELFA